MEQPSVWGGGGCAGRCHSAGVRPHCQVLLYIITLTLCGTIILLRAVPVCFSVAVFLAQTKFSSLLPTGVRVRVWGMSRTSVLSFSRSLRCIELSWKLSYKLLDFMHLYSSCFFFSFLFFFLIGILNSYAGVEPETDTSQRKWMDTITNVHGGQEQKHNRCNTNTKTEVTKTFAPPPPISLPSSLDSMKTEDSNIKDLFLLMTSSTPASSSITCSLLWPGACWQPSVPCLLCLGSREVVYVCWQSVALSIYKLLVARWLWGQPDSSLLDTECHVGAVIEWLDFW